MGAFFTRPWKRLFGTREVRILMLGLNGAGKTTILYQLKLGQMIVTIPTIGFNVETVRFKNISSTLWDIGGGDKIRLLWHHYYLSSHMVIFVIDCADRERLEEAKEALLRVAAAVEMRDAPVLVLANKQDLPNAVTADEISQGLHALDPRRWRVQSTCATTGEGLQEGLDWLTRNI